MKDKRDTIKEAEIVEETALTVQAPQDMDKPKKDTEFAHQSAKLLMDIVKQNNWAKRLGGSQDHLQYEAWQTLGKYYGCTVKTGDVEEVTLGGVSGFKARAVVVNEITGVEIGSAEAFCMRDEPNWKSKPVFQLASMAQTRAGSKALRSNFSFVVAIAGFNPTPAEEMEGVHPIKTVEAKPHYSGMATEGQVKFIHDLLLQKHYNEKSLLNKYEVNGLTELTFDQASDCITNLKKLPISQKKTVMTQQTVSNEQALSDDDLNRIAQVI